MSLNNKESAFDWYLQRTVIVVVFIKLSGLCANRDTKQRPGLTTDSIYVLGDGQTVPSTDPLFKAIRVPEIAPCILNWCPQGLERAPKNSDSIHTRQSTIYWIDVFKDSKEPHNNNLIHTRWSTTWNLHTELKLLPFWSQLEDKASDSGFFGLLPNYLGIYTQLVESETSSFRYWRSCREHDW